MICYLPTEERRNLMTMILRIKNAILFLIYEKYLVCLCFQKDRTGFKHCANKLHKCVYYEHVLETGLLFFHKLQLEHK
jgi:hypothetical protein